MPLTDRLIIQALREDVGRYDITTESCVPESAMCRAVLKAKQDGVLSGIAIFRRVFDLTNANVANWTACSDGDRFQQGDRLVQFEGRTRQVLMGERVAMNFIQHLSGVATLTASFVAQVNGTGARICDTRKTTPLFRQFEKQAVRDGGGANHRHSLSDGVLIKENHIMAAGGIRNAMEALRQRAHHLMRIEVEVRNLEEFEEAVAEGADAILLDNMPPEDMREAVTRVSGKRILLEASGNASLDRVRAMAETGVNLISVGALTHSAPAADLSLLIENVS